MKRKQFTFFGYNPPTNGEHTINGFTYKNEDFRTAERCREYKDCGFALMQLRYGHAYDGEEWESSNTNLMWNKALKAGIDKLLVTDLRIERLIRLVKGTPTDIYKSMTEKELDELIASYVAPYKDKKGFFGIQLLDEPKMHELADYGAVAKSIRRVLPNAYIQMNLHPLGTIEIDGYDKREAYEIYANEALHQTGLKNICFDEYPFRREYIISGNTIRNYQIIARVCKERSVEMQAVLQSFANAGEGKLLKRRVNESDMYWQTNLAMGFGVREYAFYTYMPKTNVSYEKGSGDGIDGACFINNDGSKTALYFYTKRIIREMQKFAPVALKYAYENNYLVYADGKQKSDFDYLTFAEENGKPPFEIAINRGVALVTEQKNGDDKLFMIENIGNIKHELFDGEMAMQVECNFPIKNLTFYQRGKKIKAKKANGKYIFYLKSGEAIFAEMKN